MSAPTDLGTSRHGEDRFGLPTARPPGPYGGPLLYHQGGFHRLPR
jgi:hypothetical protein